MQIFLPAWASMNAISIPAWVGIKNFESGYGYG